MGSMKRRVNRLEAAAGPGPDTDRERDDRLRMAQDGAKQCNDAHRRAAAIYQRVRLIGEYGGPESALAAGVDASDAALAGGADVPFVITENGEVFASRDGRSLTDYGQVIAEDAWRRELEWLALSLVRGSEPSFTLDEEGRLRTLDGRVAISKECLDLQALMGPRTRAIEEAMLLRREVWERFLVADDEGADALERLLEMAGEGDVPDNFAMTISQEWTQDEVDDFEGMLKPTAAFLDAAEREATRRLTWTLIHDPDARAMLSELTRRRDEFVADEGSMPTDLPTY